MLNLSHFCGIAHAAFALGKVVASRIRDDACHSSSLPSKYNKIQQPICQVLERIVEINC